MRAADRVRPGAPRPPRSPRRPAARRPDRRNPRNAFDAGPHGAYRAHVIALIRDAAPDLDAEYTAEALLAQLGAEVVLHQLRGRGMALTRLAAGWETIVRHLLTGTATPTTHLPALST